LGEDFSPDITNEFSLIPKLHRNPYRNPTLAEHGSTGLFYFLLIGHIAGPAGKQDGGYYLIPEPVNPMG
jgi:hypothetical protein